MKVAILENNDSLRVAIGLILKNHGFYTEEYFNPYELLKSIECHAIPDILISDIHLSDISGLDVLRMVKIKHPKIQVIIMTGSNSILLKDKAFSLGAKGFLEKPFDVSQLLEVINK
jgi:DNA-binding NtrC family response regulator